MKRIRRWIPALLSIVLLGGCLKTEEPKESHFALAIDPFGDDRLRLDVDVQSYVEYGLFSSFSSEMNLEEWGRTLNGSSVSDGVLETTVRGSYLFIRKVNVREERHYYYFDQLGEVERGYYYEFTHARLTLYDGKEAYGVLSPLHLLRKSINREQLKTKTAYPVDGTKEEILQFYRESFAYEVKEEDEILVRFRREILPEETDRTDFTLTFDETESGLTVTYALAD